MNEMLNEIETTEVIDRKELGVIYIIESLEPIPSKDRVVLCKLKNCGYTCIVEKGIHSIGDMVLFVKYDSIVPNIPMFDFMKEFKYRIKPKSFTIRDENDEVINKIYSQGIVIPIKMVYDYFMELNDSEIFENVKFVEGEDLTDYIKIRKYIPPVINSGGGFGQMIRKGDFPIHLISKTDEMNLASKIRALEEIQGKRVYITLKYEGSSCTSLWDEGRDELMVCSRNNQIGEHYTNKFWQAVNKYNLKEKMNGKKLAIQKECYGEGIQKNKLGIDGVDIAVFDVFEVGTKRRFGYDELVSFCNEHEIPMVDVVCVIENFDWDFDKLQKYADIMKYPNGEIAEGIVIRPCEPFYSKVLKGNWSFKVINREYKF